MRHREKMEGQGRVAEEILEDKVHIPLVEGVCWVKVDKKIVVWVQVKPVEVVSPDFGRWALGAPRSEECTHSGRGKSNL